MVRGRQRVKGCSPRPGPWIHEKDRGPHLLCLNKTTLLHTNGVHRTALLRRDRELPRCRSPPAQTRGGQEVGGRSHGPEEAVEGGWASCPPRKPCTSRVHLRRHGGPGHFSREAPTPADGPGRPCPALNPAPQRGTTGCSFNSFMCFKFGGNCTTLKTHLPLLNSVRLEDT